MRKGDASEPLPPAKYCSPSGLLIIDAGALAGMVFGSLMGMSVFWKQSWG